MSENNMMSFMDVATNLATLGTLGFDKDGISAGVITDPLIEGTKELTGAAAAEDANALAREQFEKDEARLVKQREDAQASSAREQVSLSKGAARARGTDSTSTSTTQGSFNNNQTDFLGL